MQDYTSRRGRRRFSRYVFGVGLVLILGWTFCQPATWEAIRNMTATERRVPEELKRTEDVSRTDRLFPGLAPEKLVKVRDFSPVFAGETPLAMTIWNRINQMSLAEIDRLSLGNVLYAQYYRQPGTYRGTVVRIIGTIRLVIPQKIGKSIRKDPKSENPEYGYDFDHYYELWIQPDDNLHEPVLVQALEVPEGLPLNQEIRIPVVIDGVFFKIYNYSSRENLKNEPMFYAKAPLWIQDLKQIAESDKKMKARKPLRIPFVVILAGAIILAGIILRIVEKRTRPEPPAEPLPDKFEMPE